MVNSLLHGINLIFFVPGMNAAIRSVVRMGIYAGARIFTVWEVCKTRKKFSHLREQISVQIKCMLIYYLLSMSALHAYMSFNHDTLWL